MTEGKLTRRQLAFIEEYLQTWNASEAARRVGYKGRANTVGPRLLLNVVIREKIDERMKELSMPAEEVLRRLTEQASASLADFLEFEEEENGEIKELKLKAINWDEVKRRGHLVKSITPTQSGMKLELHDAQAALLAMAKRHQLLNDKSEHHFDVVEMTLEEWREEQKRRNEETKKALEAFEDTNT